ncbi:MAG: M48 family metallopeptidase [Bacteroidales bacterium]|nr:M48 family metallopeptidase [Bacteroidales bacterium]HOY39749.1 DUF45 domain-containing protein [Bacteroidales bacterium]HQP04353.1 DUF45 domain-containing protein [Bacteroidales bacterium]
MQKILVSGDFGKIQILKKKGTKNIRLSVHPVTGVKISIPWYVSYEEGVRFLHLKKDWVLAKQTEFKQMQTERKGFIGDGFEFAGYKLLFNHGDHAKISARIHDKNIEVKLPMGSDLTQSFLQQQLHKFCEKALKIKASAKLPGRVEYLAKLHRFNYHSVKIGKSRTRWGSCRSDNKLTFSCYLMLLPEELIDFIIMHELCHTVFKNHSHQFHALVNQICDNNEALLTKKLKQIKHPLMYAV